MKVLFKFLILVFIFAFSAFSNEKLNYEISGNKRISDETILNIIDLRKDKKYNIDDLNNFQKKLYQTNYFSKVSINILKKFAKKQFKIPFFL